MSKKPDNCTQDDEDDFNRPGDCAHGVDAEDCWLCIEQAGNLCHGLDHMKLVKIQQILNDVGARPGGWWTTFFREIADIIKGNP